MKGSFILYLLPINMQSKAKLYFIITIVSMFTTFCMVGFYHYFINKNSGFESLQKQATSVAEREVMLSPRFLQAMRASQPNDFIEAAERCQQSVVFIKSDMPATVNSAYGESSTGSGVIISDDGYIVTNQHVVNGGTHVEVLLNDNRTFKGRVIGQDKNSDLAVVKIDASDLPALYFGDSDSLRVGEWVMAIGNPFRLQSTVTAGVVSAKARNISLLDHQGIESFIQTDAAMNPGSSGGALVNTRGDLVGICTAVLSNSGRYEGFSFAIPATLVRKVVSDIKQFGAVQRGWLGLDIENVTQDLAKSLSLDQVRGVYVASVHDDGAADASGLKADDVVLTVDRYETPSVSVFMEVLGRYRPGDQLELQVIRKGRKQKFIAILKNQINSEDLISVDDAPIMGQLGIEIRELDRKEKQNIAPSGAVVVSVKRGSIIGNTRMEPGYVVTQCNDVNINSARHFIQLMQKYSGKSVVLNGVYLNYPGKYPYTFIVP
jgi:serine protease Do